MILTSCTAARIVTSKYKYRQLHGIMNSHTLLERNGNALPIPAPLPFSSARSHPFPRGHTLSRQSLQIVPNAGFDGPGLYHYAVLAQRRTESVERLAFAALAGSGIAGILSVLI